ncbi:MAG: hypothetical protein ACI9WU_002860 [Myxococcota bacterium]|jgi:hypothetical protein
MSVLDVFFVLTVLLTLLVALGHLSRLVGSLRPGGVRLAEVDRELIELVDLKSHLLEDLRDTELDYRMSKISEEEYLRRKKQLEPRAIRVLKELEARGHGRDDVDGF